MKIATLAGLLFVALTCTPSVADTPEAGGAPDCDPRIIKCPGGDGDPGFDRNDMSPAQRCEAYTSDLSRSGYEDVRAYDCFGRYFHYYAVKDGWRVTVRIRSATGGIVWVSRW